MICKKVEESEMFSSQNKVKSGYLTSLESISNH